MKLFNDIMIYNYFETNHLYKNSILTRNVIVSKHDISPETLTLSQL